MDLLQCEPPVHTLDLQHRHPVYLMHVMWLTKSTCISPFKILWLFQYDNLHFLLLLHNHFSKTPTLDCLLYTLFYSNDIIYYYFFINISLITMLSLSLSLIIPCLSFDPPSTLFLSHIPDPDTHTWQQIWQFFHWVFCVSFLLGLILIYFSFRFGMTFLIGFDFELGFFMSLG